MTLMMSGRLHIVNMLMISVKMAPRNCIKAMMKGPMMPEKSSELFDKYFIIQMDWVTSFCNWMCKRIAHWKRATKM
jgi:hypothetical protein